MNPKTGMVINIKELKDAMEVCVAVHCEYSSSSAMLAYPNDRDDDFIIIII